MQPAGATKVRALIDELVETSSIPSASLHVRVDGAVALHHTAGLARLDPLRRAVADQVYDLASLTKALVASTVAASLVEDGTLDLDASVADHVPAVDERITLAHLLTHSAGLPKWNDFYARTSAPWGSHEARRQIMVMARTTHIIEEPGTKHIYTDIGFLILLGLLESAGRAPLDQLFDQRIAIPAGVAGLRWGHPDAAATERCPVRGAVVQGQVHDLNCFAMGGVSTHAGLFGSAREVGALGDALLGAVRRPEDHPRLPGATLGRLWTLRGAGSHAGGWDTPTRGGYTSTGRWFPDDAVGHLGYTGTSLWIAPTRHTVVVLLTNRVHPNDDLADIRRIRPIVHDAVAGALGWPQGGSGR